MDDETDLFTPTWAAMQGRRRVSPSSIPAPDNARWRGNTTAPRQLMLRVHPERCQGHARCRDFLPESLTRDGHGPVQLKANGEIPPRLFERARLAVACCPEMAIELLHE